MSYIGNEPVISAVRTITEIVATNSQSTFTANGGYTVGYLDVFVNGAHLTASDFTATNGTTVVLNDACVTGDIVRLVAWGVFSTVNVGASAGVFYENNQTVSSDYTISTNKNAMSAGTITIDSGVTVTIPSGSTWVIV